MPRRDRYHNAVKNAFVKEDWIVTHDPLILGDLEIQVYPDLGLEKTVEDRGRSTLAIEIKVFAQIGQLSEFEKAIGQYLLYRSILRHSRSSRIPYLAIPVSVYQDLFQKTIVQNLIGDETINLVVFDPVTEEIQQWID